MANRTVKDATSIKGTNPQYLVEKIIRTRIYECRYWKEECFALSAALLVDKAMELKYIGGVFGGNIKPTPFLCLILKMLQIQPEKDIIVEFLRNENFKYVRALGATYMRLTGSSLECYKYLEPLYYDYRKLKRQKRDGTFELVHMDEYIDELLTEERACDVILPRIQKRHVLEEGNQIEARVSALEEDLEEMETSDEEEEGQSPIPEKKSKHRDEKASSPHSRRKRSRSKSRDRDKRHRSRSPGKSRHRDDEDRHRKHKKHRRDHKDKRSDDRHHRSKDGDRDRDRNRHRDKERDRDKDRRADKRGESDFKESLDVRETNELRAKLGLAPLK